ncbi:MAG TPA: 3-dehydroquinate synthase family protein [Thermoanaerobaculaceae bacterium]|nr:3-dehydroquinate synthase family protein [Thermoanaerobaculaceae bacterium]HRS17839.1 3-dehydroquinate synthase family protein [Thermoanaerobaculaceae bacterium]
MHTVELFHPDGPARCLIADELLAQIAVHVDHAAPGRRRFVVTDSNVRPLYGADVAARLGALLLELPAGEDQKVWPTVETIVQFLLVNGADRESVVVGLGGGVVTDLAGFAAAVTLRGLGWVAVPTTLLGMVDAAIGGKTGINLDLGKNLVGCFWPPLAVLVDPLVLRTLPERQRRAGLAEVIKAAIIAPSSLEHLVERRLATVARGELGGAAELIAGAVRVKADVVAIDEREQGPRQALNLGHTLGHALEAATGYQRFLHGEAVAWGLLAVLRLARDRGLLSTSEAQGWAGRLERLAPLPRIDDLGWERLRPYVYRDKKRRQGAVDWVLPRLGGVVLGVRIPEDQAAAAYEALRALPPEGPFSGLF